MVIYSIVMMEEIKRQLGFPEKPTNMNHYFLKVVQDHPDRTAIIYPESAQTDISLSYKEFYDHSMLYVDGLHHAGYRKGDRLVLFFPLSLELYFLLFACFYLGIVPIFVDPGMRFNSIIKAMIDAHPKAIISLHRFFFFTLFFPKLWKVKKLVSVKKSLLFETLSSLKSSRQSKTSLPPAFCQEEDTTLITYTSGSTGSPKGANRTLRVLCHQKLISQFYWKEREGEVDMPIFPMIVLQNLGCGITSVFPRYNFTSVKHFKPQAIIEQMKKHKVTRFSCPPFFAQKLCRSIKEMNITLPHIHSIIVGGATVSREVASLIHDCFPQSENFIVYGSTEIEPISFISVKDYLKFTQDHFMGHFVGVPLPEVKIEILRLPSAPLNSPLKIEQFRVPSQEYGEIVVTGPHVVEEYIDQHPANRELKLRDSNGLLWHRTGDIGALVKKGEQEHICLLGRMSDMIHIKDQVYAPYPIEEKINQDPLVHRCALIQSSTSKKTVLFVVPNQQGPKTNKLSSLLPQSDIEIKIIKSMKFDKRHHSRVDRHYLRKLI